MNVVIWGETHCPWCEKPYATEDEIAALDMMSDEELARLCDAPILKDGWCSVTWDEAQAQKHRVFGIVG